VGRFVGKQADEWFQRKRSIVMISSPFVSKISLAKVLATAVVLTVGLAGAHGADLAPAPRYVKAPPAAAGPAWNWSGFYIGADVGGVVQKNPGASDFVEATGDGGDEITNNPQAHAPSSSAVIGGLHAGYNWQFSNVVLGVEGDWQWTNAKSSFCRQTDTGSLPCSDDGSGFLTISSETRGIGTVRGRLGYAFDRVLVYGTGGVAFVDMRDNITADCRVAGCGASVITNLTSAGFSTVKTGWVAGAGVEWMLSPNWILRSEYLHIDAGTVTNTINLAPTNCDEILCSASSSHGNRYDIGRVGVSYKFGG
jgi:outer membrane immunogenic protein